MKATGIVRKIDELGRVVIPIELRRTLKISSGDLLEIYTEGDLIKLKKQESVCAICGNPENIITYRGKNICGKCMEELKII